MTISKALSVFLSFLLPLTSVLPAAAAVTQIDPATAKTPLASAALGHVQRVLSLGPEKGLGELRAVAENPALSPLSPEREAAAVAYVWLIRPALVKNYAAILKPALGRKNFKAVLAAGNSFEAFGAQDTPVAAALFGSPPEKFSGALEAFYDGLLTPTEKLAQGRIIHEAEPSTYAVDDETLSNLGVFAPKIGLFDLVDRTRTAFGTKRLERLLRRPLTDPAQLRRRQDAVRELLENEPLRHQVEKAFEDLGESAGAPVLGHFERKDGYTGHFLFLQFSHLFLVIFFGGIMLSMGRLPGVAQVPHHSFVTLMRILIGLVFPSVYIAAAPGGGRLIREVRMMFRNYRKIFETARLLAEPLSKSRSEALRGIGSAFSKLDQDGPDGLKGARRTFGRVMSPAATELLDFLYLHSAKTLLWVQHVFRKHKTRMAALLSALADLDVYRSFAQYALERKEGERVLPAIRADGPAYLRIEDVHHPLLLSREKSVANSLGALEAKVGEANFLMITGSNMGGKSTYEKTVLIVPILAQAGGVVPAKAAEQTILRVMTSMGIQENLAKGKSLYDAETDRVLELVRRAGKETHWLFGLDEILSGTNPEERTAAEWAIMPFIAGTNNLFLLATHNLSVTKLAESDTRFRNVHVEEKLENGKMTFSYRVLPGPSTTRNGIMTLEVKGFPAEIVAAARAYLEGRRER